MIPEIRKKFNAEFSDELYAEFQNNLNSVLRYPVDFRVCETPLFLSNSLSRKLQDACADIVSQLLTSQFKEHSSTAIPAGWETPREDEHPYFLQVDFAIAEDSSGELIPQLIELQGFPSLYGFQVYLSRLVHKTFNLPAEFTPYFNVTEYEYIEMFREVLLAGEKPENVILLEIEPWRQKTRVDFVATEELTGVKAVCVSKVKKSGRNLYYLDDAGNKIDIRRIYNRVIRDELVRTDIATEFSFSDDLDVAWIGHPNWFYRISKHSLPFLKGKYSPACMFLSDAILDELDLKKFVLKPLYSFAGSGVEVDIQKEHLVNITDKQNYILQEKVNYADLVETPEGYSKAEIRMMFLWQDKPLLVNNLVRTSKGKMMGVDFNKNKTWVGSNCAFHQAE